MQRTMALFTALALGLGMALLPALVAPAAAQPARAALPPVTNTDGRAGLCYSFYPGPQGQDRYYLPLAVQAGSRWDRFDFSWLRLEPEDNVWDSNWLAGYDDLVSDLRDAGVQNIVGILLWTPEWAATGGAQGMQVFSFDKRPTGWYAPTSRLRMAPQAVSAASSPPRGLYEEWNDWTEADGDEINYWGRFVYTVTYRYKSHVKYWEIWNEPEWSYFWSGTSTDYTQLLKVGYQATKAACPDCKVLFGGLHYWANRNYYRWVLRQINQDPEAPSNNYFFDIMSVHLYSRSSNTYDEIANIRSGMTTYNVGDHPIWLTETGVPVWGDAYEWVPALPKYDYAATRDEAAAYLIQSYANALASGVERYFFFRTHDDWCDKNRDGDCNDQVDGGMSEAFGLVRDNGTLRPAYFAYQVAATYLISPTFTTREVTGGGINVTLWGTPRGKVSVLWNPAPTATVYTLAAARPTATLVYRSGDTQPLTAIDNAYTILLPGATANLVSNPDDYIIGGDPRIVIESETNSAPPTSTVHPLPAVTVTPSFTVTWGGQDNESGVQFYDVQVRDGSGAWTLWKQWTTGTSGVFTGVHGHTYSFRVRATDRVGNRADWPNHAQASTTLDLASTLHLVSIGPFFTDENRNDVWDTGSGEIALSEVRLVFRDGAGRELIGATVSGPRKFTTTILAGETYWVHLTATIAMTDYIRLLPFTWPRGREVYTESLGTVGLRPAKHVYMPLVMRRY